jgi:hypothetical protein
MYEVEFLANKLTLSEAKNSVLVGIGHKMMPGRGRLVS